MNDLKEMTDSQLKERLIQSHEYIIQHLDDLTMTGWSYKVLNKALDGIIDLYTIRLSTRDAKIQALEQEIKDLKSGVAPLSFTVYRDFENLKKK